MEELLSFILGVVIVALPYIVVVMFKTRKRVEALTLENQNLIKYIDSEISELEAKINDLVTFTDLSHHAIEKLQYQLADLQVAFENQINNK